MFGKYEWKLFSSKNFGNFGDKKNTKKNERTKRKQKQNQENDAATLAKAKENVEKNDITKYDLKFVSDAFGKCLNGREGKRERRGE